MNRKSATRRSSAIESLTIKHPLYLLGSVLLSFATACFISPVSSDGIVDYQSNAILAGTWLLIIVVLMAAFWRTHWSTNRSAIAGYILGALTLLVSTHLLFDANSLPLTKTQWLFVIFAAPLLGAWLGASYRLLYRSALFADRCLG